MNNRVWVWVGVTVVSVLGAVAIAGIPDNSSSELLAESPLTTVATTTSTTTTPTTETTPPTTEPVDSTPPITEAPETPATEAPAPTDAVPTTEPTPTTTEPLAPRADVSVVVANGAAIGGVAGATADRLRDLGYVDVRTIDADDVVELTLVFALPGFQDVATRLALDVGVDPQLVFPISEAPDASGLDDEPVLLYLGRDVLSLG